MILKKKRFWGTKSNNTLLTYDSFVITYNDGYDGYAVIVLQQ